VLAIAALRIELLHAAVVYGVYSVLSEEGEELVSKWLAWLHWVESLFLRVRAEVDPGADGTQTPAWLQQQILALLHSEERELGDLFDDEAVRDWARVQFECLAERARPIEQAGGEPLGEIQDIPLTAGKRLLGAVQDSLVLASAEDAKVRSKRASAAEILDDLIAARDQGVWDMVLD
jgi:hypothetical protein